MARPSTTNQEACTTTILLSNLHCPSCVRTVDDTLRQYADGIEDVSTSTVAQTVTIKHSSALPASTIARALYDIGFDVQSMWEQHAHQRMSRFVPALFTPAQPVSSKRLTTAFSDFSCGLIYTPDERSHHDAKHSTYCEQCAQEEGIAQADSQTHLTRPAADELYDDKKAVADQITIVTAQAASEALYKVVIAIDGMTCSACVGRVAEVLRAKSYARDVNVNLLSNSASIIIDDQSKAPELVDEIEDIGYDAKLESCNVYTIDSTTRQSYVPLSEERTVMIRVKGFHCPHCPQKVTQTIATMPGVEIISAPTPEGLLTVSYTPQLPSLTIRHILRHIECADSAFSAEVFRPPSLEERARRLQLRHQRHVAVRLVLSVLLAIPTFVFGVVIMDLLSTQSPIRQYWTSPLIGQTPRVQWILLPLATVAYFCAADLFHRRAVKEIYMMWRPASRVPFLRRLYRFGSMDMLLSLGTSVAFFGSIAIVIMTSLQNSSNDMDTMDSTTYFDAVVFLTMFLLSGRLLEAYGKAQTADAVTSLGSLRPAVALLLTSTEDPAMSQSMTQPTAIDQLEAGDIVLVPAGGSPPCDGIVHQGATTVDESSLTGEAKPVPKSLGDEIFAGTVNITTAVQVKITGAGGMSLLDKIIDTVREGQSKRAPIERVADLLTGYFVPLIVVVALLDWIIWMTLGLTGHVPYVQAGVGGWVFWSLQFAIAVLVVACPCGIGLAAPTALFVGIGIAAKQGILVKGGGEAFQDASTLDCVVFDKTGTITEGGSPRITDHCFFSNDAQDRNHLLDALHMLESTSSHPLARAVVDFCSSEGTRALIAAQEVKELPGQGMIGRFERSGRQLEVLIGNVSLSQQQQITMTPEACDRFAAWSSQGKTVMLVGSRGADDRTWSLNMMLAAADPIRTEAANIVAGLSAQGIEVWLLSGDNETTARVVAAQAGISPECVIAGVLPHEKAERIRYLQSRSIHKSSWWGRSSRRTTVAMVGDGINDAPALATADVGIAMGSGSDTAISTASFVLLSSDLTAVLTLLRLSKAVLRRVKFNFGWAMAYNLIMLPIAAGALFPAVSNGSHIRLDPVWASLAMALSSVSVVISSLLLRTRLYGVGFRDR